MAGELDEERAWLIMTSCFGNCALFWRAEGKGYTCDLNEAGRFTEAAARRQEKIRSIDRAVPLTLAKAHAVVHVGIEALQRALEKA